MERGGNKNGNGVKFRFCPCCGGRGFLKSLAGMSVADAVVCIGYFYQGRTSHGEKFYQFALAR